MDGSFISYSFEEKSMKKKILGLCFLTVLSLSFSVVVSAEENSTETSEETAQTVAATVSTETNLSTEEPAQSVLSSQTTEATRESVEDNQTTSSESAEPAVPETQIETPEGTMNLPKGRSDLYPTIQLYSAVPASSVTNTNTPSKNFIDISSHNGNISVANFQKIKSYGVTGVVVKLTEATSYTNPYAQVQINNAKAAGLKVSAYHYSWFINDAQAVAEANYFAAAAKRFGLTTSAVMVNDIEEPQIAGKGNHTNNSKAFENRLKALGYENVRHYIGLNWLDSKNPLINASTIGNKNIWVAAYPYYPKENLYLQYGAWQWSAQLTFPGINGNFDINADYTGTFSSQSTPTPPANTVQMYRLYNRNSGEHFYTQNAVEKNNLITKGWNYEGVAWNGPTSGSPVYRLYNRNAGDHHYTLHAYEKDNLIKKGWRYEGISWYSGGSNVLQRLYNPNAKAGSHHYTLNVNEKNNLVSKGWKYEGVAWYAK